MTAVELPPQLMYFTDEQAGIIRKKCGSGFSYFSPRGARIKDRDEITRIKSLVVPPAWKKVWIAPLPHAHLQATGRDDQNRKQYRYHDLWTEYAKSRKYLHLIDFGKALPQIRKNYSRDLRRKKWDFKKVAALAVAVMDSLHLRVGSNYYSKVNHSYGLTTLRRKHLELGDESLEISFKGKTGRERQLKLEDKKLIRLIKECSELPGYELFRYRSQEGLNQLKSEDFNDYLRQISGEASVSAKDFRTWGANVLCLEKVEEAKRLAKDSRKTLENRLVKLVAKEMGHTIATCKNSYLHPQVLGYALNSSKKKSADSSAYDVSERILLDILTSVVT